MKLPIYLLSGILMVSCQRAPVLPLPLEILDRSLELDLIAQQPDIQTPIGMAIDEQDNLYILESHTHTPMSDYPGPKFDRIKKGIDSDKDGIPESWLIFADSLEDGMNLAYDPRYGLLVTTKNSVLRLEDRDEDGFADQRLELLNMIKPDNVYDHAGILGLAISVDGWVYVSRGNTGGHYWKIIGTDQSSVEGYGDGGNVFRCRPDGSKVEEVATGFWNPFDIKFSAEGRLLLTDNDPDSRGPNRLIELVPGGDYGYQSIYGNNGIHPYLAWNGELPGTLPYAAPLGEAPCALIDARFTNFGPSYYPGVLVNIWEENNIVRVPLQPQGSSLSGTPQVLVQGDSLFHPVALVANSKGDLYITDWVIRQYPNHGHGKIWRLRSKKTNASPSLPGPTADPVNRFAESSYTEDAIIQTLRSGDPFEKTIIRHYLTQTQTTDLIDTWLSGFDPELKLQALLIYLKRTEPVDRAVLQTLLVNEHPEIRRMTLIYIGKKGRTDLEATLPSVLGSGQIGPALFETYLATIRHLQPGFIRLLKERTEPNSKKIPRVLPEGYIAGLLTNPQIEESTRALALPYLDNPADHQLLLTNLLATAQDPDWQYGLLNSLKGIQDPNVAEELLQLAIIVNWKDEVRARAVQVLSLQTRNYCAEISGLLKDPSPLIQYAALKYLCRCKADAVTQAAVEALWSRTSETTTLRAVWEKCSGQAGNASRSFTEWEAAGLQQGHPQRGRLVFNAPAAQCTNCHRINGWGGTYGPDLSNIGSSKSKPLLIRAILTPSSEIAPEWQGWYVTDQQGGTHYGRQIDVNLHFAELMNIDGSFEKYENPQGFGITNTSLMPEGLHHSMTKQEFSDLITYLSSLQ